MPYPATPTVWLEPTDRVAVGLRRYRSSSSGGTGFTCETGYHSALVFVGQAPAVYRQTEDGRVLDSRAATPHDDPSWPAACGCGYTFTDADVWQDWQELIYRRADTGAEVTLRHRHPTDAGGPAPAPPGAMWDAWWMPQSWRGPDGIALTVRLPNGRDWMVDAEASNCTRKGDRSHKCWVRHGDPRTGTVHVDKDGDTCAAGAGSIQAGDYHGFLQLGFLTAG
jgi:hypothetical protein